MLRVFTNIYYFINFHYFIQNVMIEINQYTYISRMVPQIAKELHFADTKSTSGEERYLSTYTFIFPFFLYILTLIVQYSTS